MSIYSGSSEIKNIVMGPSPKSMQGPCSTGFHIPKYNEFVNLHNIGVNIGAWANDGIGEKELLKIPLAGYRDAGNSAIFSQGGDGIYRCSEADGMGAKRIGYSSGGIVLNYISWRGNGISIRPFKDTPVVPDSGWTTLYAGTGDAGIFHDSGNGLISLSSDGVNWITIADKNLGATTVWNNGDTLSQNNCGYYYQRGNNYGFPRTGGVTTSGTQVDASNYGPGNYYNSSTFTTGSASPYDRSSVQNDNLRGGQYTPVKKIYVGSTKVRPGWEVSSDTLAYRPLNTTNGLNDISGNGKNLSISGTASNVNTGTHNGVDCTTTYTTAPKIHSGLNSFSATSYTFAMWFYAPGNGNIHGTRTYTSDTKAQQRLEVTSSGFTSYVSNSNSSYGTTSWSGTTNIKNQRILYVFRKSGKTYRVYFKGNGINYYSGDQSATNNDTRNSQIYIGATVANNSGIANGCYSNAVLESKLWTDSDVNLYYNTFKSLYGIS